MRWKINLNIYNFQIKKKIARFNAIKANKSLIDISKN